MLKSRNSRAVGLIAAVVMSASVAYARQVKPQQTRDPKAPAAQQVGGTGVIAGVVVTADAGRPVRRARVTIAGGAPKVSRTIQSDDQGAFRFAGLPAGDYTIRSSKGGFVETIYGQRKPGSGRPGTPVQLIAGQERNQLSLPLVRGGVITGMVVDEVGEPMFGTEVRVYRWVMKSGERTLESVGYGSTDDRGIYRVPSLTAGEYVVSTVPSTMEQHIAFGEGSFSVAIDTDASYIKILSKAMEIKADKIFVGDVVVERSAESAPPAPTTGFATLYYPGTTQASGAMSVTVTPGEERGGVDFQLQVLPLGKVSGVLVGADGLPVRGDVQLIDRSAPMGLGGRGSHADKEGRFSFSGIPPGQYTLFARATPKGGKPLEANAREAAEFLASTKDEAKRATIAGNLAAAAQVWAMTDIAVDGRELNGVQLALQPGMTISGQVLIESASGPPPSLTRLSLTVAQVGQHFTGEGMEPPPAAVDANGRFTIRGVMPGRYRIAAAGGVPSGYTIKSAMVGGVDVLDTPIELTGNEQPSGVVVTFSTRATELNGVVQDDANQPVAGVTVIAFSAEERYWVPESRRIAAMRPSSDGKFVMKNLPPGDYRLAAVTDVEQGQWFDPAFLRTLGVFSTFAVSEGGKVTQNIR